MPAYNEASTIVGVLERLEPLADEIIVVDDGSLDDTRRLVEQWAAGRTNVRVLGFEHNRGMSAAYCEAFEHIGARVRDGELTPDDIVLTVDADGQHEPADVDRLVERLDGDGLDAVIARRDFALYPWYKRIGNWLMSAWGTLWAGQRLDDIESGFRVFRIGPLLHALQFYRGYKYSETVEVAVILPRLGYGLANDVTVPVPIFRSNTRIKDFVIDGVAMPWAWWRVWTRASRPAGIPAWAIDALPALAVTILAFIAVALLAHPLFLADDSMHHYAHVWYLSQQLFEQHRLPLHIATLDGGDAVMFPYGLVPYLIGALLYRPLGDFTLVLMMTAAVLAIVWAAGVARPVMRSPWFLLLFLINPFFLDVPFAFQFSSAWSIFSFFLFVWAFERRRYVLSAAILWLSVSSHPIMGLSAAGGYAAWLLLRDRARLRPLILLGIPTGLALIPALWMTVQTPALHQSSPFEVASSVLDTVPRRGTIFALPFLFAAARPTIERH